MATQFQRRFLIAMLLGGIASGALAQPSAEPDYSRATAEQLISEADRLKEAGEFSAEASAAIAQRAVELLLEADYSLPEEAATRIGLVELARVAVSTLSEEQKAQLTARLAAAPPPAASAGFEEFKSRILVEQIAGTSRKSIADIVAQWLEGRDLNELSVEQVNFCFASYRQHPEKRKKFHIVWTGRITAPRTGNFTFSISPINLNKELGNEWVRHSIEIDIDGAAVLRATPEAWNWRSEPIAMQAGESKAVRVELDFDCHHPLHSEIPSALFMWEGPGIAQQIVPAQALSQPDGSGTGLRGEYDCFDVNGNPERTVQQDSTIDFVWATSTSLAPPRPELVARLSQALWQLSTTPEYLASCIAAPAGEEPNNHPYVDEYYNIEYLTRDQRRQFMRILVEEPALLQRLSDAQMLRIYRKMRYGAEDEGLDMLGTWMQLHADIEPKITEEFFAANRSAYRHLTLYVLWQLPNEFRKLEDRYLEAPDGRCVLPVAYTSAYCYLVQGQIESWIALLDSKLDEAELTGDRRVNWLLARAMAEELRRSSADRHHAHSTEDLASGTGWIDEASLHSQGFDTKYRLSTERIARLATIREWEPISTEIDAIRTSALNPAHDQRITALAAQVADLKLEVAALVEGQKLQEQRAYLNELKRRQERAAARGNVEVARRYDELINAHNAEND